MNQVATVDQGRSPLATFDEATLKGMGTQIVDSGAPRTMFLPASMAEAMEIAKLMAKGNFVPKHLRGTPGDCLAVVMQSARWGMDPFAVGNKTYFVNDRMAYESQLVNAVVNSSNVLDGRLSVKWEGEGDRLVCIVSGKIKGDAEAKTRRVALKNITTRNSPLWKQDPEQQLAYFATRAWSRLFTPEVLMGVYTPDEVRDIEPVDGGELSSRPLTGAMLIDQAKGSEARENARSAYAEHNLNDGTLSEDNPFAQEGSADEQRGEEGVDYGDAAQETAEAIDGPLERDDVRDRPTWADMVDQAKANIAKAASKAELTKLDREFQRHMAVLPDDVVKDVDAAFAARRKVISEAKEG